MMPQEKGSVRSLGKALELLELLNRSRVPMTLQALSQASGYPKSTVFGLLTTMRAYDVITQTPEGKYALGLRLFEYGRQVERKWDISRVARPYMEHLSQRTGASVMLSICEGAASSPWTRWKPGTSCASCRTPAPACPSTVRPRARSFWPICPAPRQRSCCAARA